MGGTQWGQRERDRWWEGYNGNREGQKRQWEGHSGDRGEQ